MQQFSICLRTETIFRQILFSISLKSKLKDLAPDHNITKQMVFKV